MCSLCCGSLNKPKREIIILLYRRQLIYGIENGCYIEGDIMGGDTEGHLKHSVIDIGQEGNADRMNRILELSFAHCVELLYKYTHEEVWREVTNNEPGEDEVMTLHLRVPGTFSQTTVDYLTKLVHDLIVSSVVADWLSITKPEASKRWVEKATAAENEIRLCMNSNHGRYRIRQRPF